MSKTHHMTPPLLKKQDRRPPRVPKTKQRSTTKDACSDCRAACCHDLTVHIERPRNQNDADYYRWHLQYDTVSIVISNRRWYLWIKGRCMYLDDHHFCTVYDRRPPLCRSHNPPACEKFDNWYETLFMTPEDLDDFLAKEKARKKRRAKAAAKKKEKNSGKKRKSSKKKT